MKAAPKNVAASVLARLRKHAGDKSLSFNDVLQTYVNDSFLARLAKSKHSSSVILKGAQILPVLGVTRARPTMDIDFLRCGAADPDTLVALVKDCASIEILADAVVFFPDSIDVEKIHEEADYVGTRIRIDAGIDNVRQRVQLDFGVGDAEKFHTMVKLDIRNCRMKDFYDVWILSRELEFSAKTLRKSIHDTFERRDTTVPAQIPAALTERFSEDATHGKQWAAFTKRINEPHLSRRFASVITELAEFFSIVIEGRMTAKDDLIWTPGGPWTSTRKAK